MSVILYDNTHVRDYWNGSNERMKTWLILEDNGSEDGGGVIAEFREREHAKAFCDAMGWVYFE